MEPHHNMTITSGNTHLVLNLVQENPAIAGVATICISILTIAILFGASSSTHKHGNTSPPSSPAYWFPFFAHCFQFVFNKKAFLEQLRKSYPEGIFSLTLLGKKHHFVHEPSMLANVWSRPRTSVEVNWLTIRVLSRSFGLHKKHKATYGNLSHETPDLYKHMLSEPGLSQFVDCIVDQVKMHIADFVTFNSSPADQTDWERSAKADVVQNSKGEAFVEADLMTLVRNFVAKTANGGLFGTDFVENFPEFWEMMWMLDDCLVPIALGVPGWIPWPKMQRAKFARRRMIAQALEFEEAMEKYLDGEDPGIKWQDLENVSTLVKSRIRVFREHGLPADARASCDIALAWTMNANANILVSWMLFELCRDPVLLETVREEIAPYVKVVQPQNEFGDAVWVAPELETLDMDGLINQCPTLKAAYFETMRRYTGIHQVRYLVDDIVLESKGEAKESYLLQKGGMTHMAHELHQFDPAYFPNPEEWHHDRFMKETTDEEGRKKYVVDSGTLRPYGAGPGMCKGRAVALREMLYFTGMILSFYDLVPPEGTSWEEPKLSKRAVTKQPAKPIKVWIRRRTIHTQSAGEKS
ncbi:cytochrome P450 [Pochonia chlamydosporia 170]|uniref:Cytochrome P450 n=1 Tax=Pochonia chlamydosporia 170 TaxID=1380566 RepID=A0A179FLA8_METCM|nr:cytochrome P450 [Pochonia chlamydosporia 170]OAQ66128.2 cytochrome P450 [Pochonia chlamydosporia 170]